MKLIAFPEVNLPRELANNSLEFPMKMRFRRVLRSTESTFQTALWRKGKKKKKGVSANPLDPNNSLPELSNVQLFYVKKAAVHSLLFTSNA